MHVPAAAAMVAATASGGYLKGFPLSGHSSQVGLSFACKVAVSAVGDIESCLVALKRE